MRASKLTTVPFSSLAVLFLASDESSYVSGATLGVHAGQVP